MEGRRPEVLLGDELDVLRSGYFRCDYCRDWVKGQVPSLEVNVAINRGIVIYEEYCRNANDEADGSVKRLHADKTRIRKVNNQEYPIVPSSSRDFPLNSWEAEFIDKQNFEHSLRSQFNALARFELPLDFSPQCLLIQVAVVLALCKQAGLIVFPWGHCDSTVLDNLKYKLQRAENGIVCDIEDSKEPDKECRCYTPRHGNLGYNPFHR
jgi:hypothetical protein